MLAQRCRTPLSRDLGTSLPAPGSEPWLPPGHPQEKAFHAQSFPCRNPGLGRPTVFPRRAVTFPGGNGAVRIAPVAAGPWIPRIGLGLALSGWPSLKKSLGKCSAQKSFILLLIYDSVFHPDLKENPSSHCS